MLLISLVANYLMCARNKRQEKLILELYAASGNASASSGRFASMLSDLKSGVDALRLHNSAWHDELLTHMQDFRNRLEKVAAPKKK